LRDLGQQGHALCDQGLAVGLGKFRVRHINFFVVRRPY
jgi:hypothetical protein